MGDHRIRGASKKIQLEGKAEANGCVLSCFLKVWIVEHDITEIGREFQMVEPADLNSREPKTVLTCGTQSLCALEERRARKET